MVEVSLNVRPRPSSLRLEAQSDQARKMSDYHPKSDTTSGPLDLWVISGERTAPAKDWGWISPGPIEKLVPVRRSAPQSGVGLRKLSAYGLARAWPRNLR